MALSLERGAAVTRLDPEADTLADGLEGGIAERRIRSARGAVVRGVFVVGEADIAQRHEWPKTSSASRGGERGRGAGPGARGPAGARRPAGDSWWSSRVATSDPERLARIVASQGAVTRS